MFLLSLIAALAGTPLRQAEAAHDLACSLAELDGRDVLEEIDGGVGDDSDATIKSETAHASVILTIASAAPTEITPPLSPPRPLPTGRSARAPRLATGSYRWHALLQRFLF
jgi:hypothetical protein